MTKCWGGVPGVAGISQPPGAHDGGERENAEHGVRTHEGLRGFKDVRGDATVK